MLLDRSKAPEYIIPAGFELTAPSVKKLADGRSLFFVHTPNHSAVKLEVIGKSQRLSLPLEKSLIPSVTLQMLTEGTRKLSESQLSEFFDFHASEVHPLATYTHEGMSLVTTKKHLFDVLPVFSSLFEQATFPMESLEKRKSQRKLGLKMEREKSASRANQLFRKALFGANHPYGMEVTEGHVDTIQQKDLFDYYQTSLLSDAEFFLCGDLTEAELEETLIVLNEIPLRNGNTPNTLPDSLMTPKILEDRPQALQSSIRLGNWSIPKSHPDFLALSVFNTILGGYFGSRLIKNIREDKGHTYGINSSLSEIGDRTYWVIGADVKKAHKEEVIAEIYKEIDCLANVLISNEELEVVRNYMIGQMIGRFSSSFDLIDRFRAVHHSGLDFDFYVKKLEFLREFKAKDILEIGKKHYNNPPFIEVVVG
ncbi:M16 family metallopeptidase [Algoriphagus boritolerans]|uniref:Predicted Zn-dependent peptidase n=1 Tax=Algoriphagus boritolerans DSM 17298 = JCM 18970 TaxID=1120964 RepID=A0A1H5X829_9BACT|nr:pitrilysin family protein [Algoriphagus boritolerans]SEG07527.1 Predicted Zn-dependent peptidase [Algoriphagus boritolerans DSM 17298 = JCM 18970]